MKKIAGIFCIFLCAATLLGAKEFRFKYIEGEKYRVLSQVQEDVYINDRFSHSAEILNKISIHVEKTKDNSGYLVGEFLTSERSSGSSNAFTWENYNKSEYWRDEYGMYDIEKQYVMPVVRNVPKFPERNLEVGDQWVGAGHEVHDFRHSLGIPKLVRFPITVSYTYKGTETRNDIKCDVIAIEYTVFNRPHMNIPRGATGLERITGFSNQTLYWDSLRGRPYEYEEEFDFVFKLSNGTTIEYTGTAEARVIDSSIMDRDKIANEINEEFKKQGIEDAGAESDEDGVKITLEDINFYANKSEFLPGEKEELARIGEILKKYPERDILVEGHAAKVGSSEFLQQLSEDRAQVVAEFLLEQGVRKPEQMVVRGMGTSEPIGDNSTKEGRKKNRRVEITILEN